MNCVLCGDTGVIDDLPCWGCIFDTCKTCGFPIISETKCPKCAEIDKEDALQLAKKMIYLHLTM